MEFYKKESVATNIIVSVTTLPPKFQLLHLLNYSKLVLNIDTSNATVFLANGIVIIIAIFISGLTVNYFTRCTYKEVLLCAKFGLWNVNFLQIGKFLIDVSSIQNLLSISITHTLSFKNKLNGTLNTFTEPTTNTGADASLFTWTGYNISSL